MIYFDKPPLKEVLPILLRGLKIDTLPKPRALKSDDEKSLRTRTLAEVFTPSHVVKFMVDAIDDGQIDSRWLEIACGEAPFITNRYDAESGEDIPLDERAGILDKKLRRIPPNVDKYIWASRAVQSVYGCELQSDSLLIARANVLLTIAEFVGDCSIAELKEVAEIISKNFWRTDILKPPPVQISLFDDAIDWNTGDEIFLGGSDMKKFNFVIGNPPYQDDTTGGNKTFAPPVYDKFMEAAQKVGEKVELITPARFLFNAGATPKDFNQRMLDDPHLKVLDYAPDAKKYFKGVDIEGGVAITLHDETQDFGVIGTFTAFPELNSIYKKVVVDNPDFRPLSDIISGRTPYLFTDKLHEDFPDVKTKLSKGHAHDISSNAFEVLPETFFNEKPSGDDCFRIFGRRDNARAYCWIKKEYARGRVEDYIGKWKVFLPKANGRTGSLGEEPAKLISNSVIGKPLDICTDTFLVVGVFDTVAEAEACLKYINDKFARVMLGILKITQDNTADKWAKVPMQDFNPATSDIDWSGNVDAQLYAKYGLDDTEINFIESHVKEMA